MSKHEQMLAAIAAFYDAALDETLWPAALRTLTDLTGSQASTFWVLDGSRTPCLPTFLYINFDQASIAEYVGGMAPLDPTVRYLVANPRQAIVHDGLLPDGGDEKSRAYADWHRRNIETTFRMVGQSSLASKVQAGIALHRTRRAGRYEARDIEAFSVLHQYLQRALAIGARIGSLGAMEEFGREWLDRSRTAILLLDRQGNVVFLNRRAEALQSAGDGLCVSPDGVSLARRQDDAQLRSLIAEAMAPAMSPGAVPSGAMRAERPSGKRPYAIFVAALSRRSLPQLALVRPAVCVVIADPDDEAAPAADMLRLLFGLTRAEARLAARLTAGEELRATAETLGITYGTARTCLAQIFQKTETRRQGELVRLLLTVLPVA